MSNKSKNNGKKFNSTTLLIVAVFLLAYFFYIKTRDKIINHPTQINHILFFTILGSLFLFHYKNFKIEISNIRGKDLYLYVSLKLGKNLIIAWFFSGIILIPFNYYNIHTAKENPLEIINCEIQSISTYSKNRVIFFSLNERTNVIYDFKPIMENIKDNGVYRDYYFVAKLRKGLLESYILEDWDIQKR